MLVHRRLRRFARPATSCARVEYSSRVAARRAEKQEGLASLRDLSVSRGAWRGSEAIEPQNLTFDQ
jgi:hypothetical protein